MNFLSHYYIRQNISNPHFTLGKIMPDMMRQFGPQNKMRHAENWQQPEKGWKWIEKGAFVHLATDKHFHNSEFFKSKTTLIKKRLRETLKADKYIYFLGHVLLELLLDRLIVKHKTDVARTFYKELNLVDKATISHFFRYKELNLDEDRFFHNLRRFTESRYLFQYAENDGLIYSLDRVLERVGLKMFDKSDNSQLVNTIADLEATISTDYLSIFNELENVIPE